MIEPSAVPPPTLLLRCSRPNTEAHAYSTLAEQVCQSIRHYLGWRWGSQDIAEDCLQIARVSVWQARTHFNSLPEEAWRAYATVCARRAVVRCLRREQKQQECHTYLEREYPPHQGRVILGVV